MRVSKSPNGLPSWAARVRRLTHLGPLVRVEIALDDGTELVAQIPNDRSRELALAPGDAVYVTPRDVKVFQDGRAFVEDYVI